MNISCFDQPVPTFKGERFLEKASLNKELNIERVREKFSNAFVTAMGQVIERDTRDLKFELVDPPEMKDLSQEVEDAKQQTEEDMERKNE